MKVKEESEKAGLTLNIQKTKIMASSPNISWQINGGGNGNIDRFYSLRLQNHYKITMDGDCNHEIKMLAPQKKSYDKRKRHIKEQRHHFANKGPSS